MLGSMLGFAAAHLMMTATLDSNGSDDLQVRPWVNEPRGPSWRCLMGQSW